MKLFDWANKKIQTYNVWDIGALKIFCTIVGMILGAYVSVFVIQNIWWFVVIAIILFLILIIKFFKAKV